MTKCFTRPRGFVLAAVLLAAACDRTPAAVPPPSVLSAEVDSAAGPIFRTLDVRLENAAGVQVTYWAPGVEALRVRDSAAAERHRVFLPRLRAGLDYAYEVRALAAGGGSGEPLRGAFATGPLPPLLAALRFRAVGAPSQPVTMLEPILAPDDTLKRLVAVDGQGRVVWYYPHEGGLKVLGFARRARGDYVLVDWGRGVRDVAPDGTLLAEIRAQPGGIAPHHDVVATPGNTVLFLSAEGQTFGGVTVTGEAIWEWNPDSGALVRRWRSSDHLSWPADRGPLSDPLDWLHANSLAVGPRGNVIVSFRATHQVISLSPDFRTLEWRLGGQGSTFHLADDDRFWGQHTASEPAEGRVLVFDNGFSRPSPAPYSRALELALDPATGTARKVWEFRAVPDNYGSIMGSARRLPNGNTLVEFADAAGVAGSSGPVEVYEVDPAGRAVWNLQLVNAPSWQFSYRATPLADLAGEYEVAQP